MPTAPPADPEGAAYGLIAQAFRAEGWVVGHLRRPVPGVRVYYDFEVTSPAALGARVTFRLELKAATPRTERTWRRSVTPIWAVKPHRRAELRYEFAAHTSSFMTNAWQPGSKGCHILVFAAWEEGSWEFWPVPLRAPLLGVPGRRSPAGQRLWSSSWEGPKSRLDEHFGAQGNLPLRCESWALDVHEAVAAKATQPAPTARRRAAPAPDGLALAREFLSKRGRKA